MANVRKIEKAAMRQRARELRTLLDEWDPIGVMGPDFPPGATEYDDLLWPLLRLLQRRASASELAQYLCRTLDDDYGVTPAAADLAGVASRIKEWFEAKRPDPRAQ